MLNDLSLSQEQEEKLRLLTTIFIHYLIPDNWQLNEIVKGDSRAGRTSKGMSKPGMSSSPTFSSNYFKHVTQWLWFPKSYALNCDQIEYFI